MKPGCATPVKFGVQPFACWHPAKFPASPAGFEPPLKRFIASLVFAASALHCMAQAITPLPDLTGDAPLAEAGVTNLVLVPPVAGTTNGQSITGVVQVPANTNGWPTNVVGTPPDLSTLPKPTPASRVCFSQCHVSGPYIALTFDDGPHPENTVRLLKMLKERGMKATFFCVGQRVADHPSVAKRIVDEGHEIGNHSWSHKVLSGMTDAAVARDLERTDEAIRKATGVAPKLMRPPYGAFTDRQRDWAHRKWGYSITLWDVDSNDWRNPSAAYARSRILQGTGPGSIVLSHDIHKSTVDGMPKTLDALKAKGFKFVTVSELLALEQETLSKLPANPAPQSHAVKTVQAKPARASVKAPTVRR